MGVAKDWRAAAAVALGSGRRAAAAVFGELEVVGEWEWEGSCLA